ncbi:hypothetical protein PHSY_002241 [Pseudozyma hubeiensis SY62]|uniref:Uncharacterized protein n=1 Tax=Pseudozyma hubeiensis (strain SY62) TaxID=1305764 RepID=R9P0E4_PSEHS|nr:hypothetical protein PHSY_002241 [Pseudozyma hubeiensis SY62]GAC94668.1 hypothetical protein PHSY_002241 [Pseudozyma hubeiensis SY62]
MTNVPRANLQCGLTLDQMSFRFFRDHRPVSTRRQADGYDAEQVVGWNVMTAFLDLRRVPLKHTTSRLIRSANGSTGVARPSTVPSSDLTDRVYSSHCRKGLSD